MFGFLTILMIQIQIRSFFVRKKSNHRVTIHARLSEFTFTKSQFALCKFMFRSEFSNKRENFQVQFFNPKNGINQPISGFSKSPAFYLIELKV